ncbi:hypothetical protein [Vibrio lentus]|uniref:hypothetical protein n=1 Tax=Vibrio lentus TaxID=136468 RepID=UPI001E410ABD|nr:hypothetical protein [Vibrio lentus]MCC4838122.1 hypothetical protein [Vibrio lentus]
MNDNDDLSRKAETAKAPLTAESVPSLDSHIDMIYLINEHGHYFQVTKEAWNKFDSDYLLRAGCDIYSTKQSMYDAYMKSTGFALDEIEGSEIEITLNEQDELIERDDRGIYTLIEEDDDDYNDWLAAYKL